MSRKPTFRRSPVVVAAALTTAMASAPAIAGSADDAVASAAWDPVWNGCCAAKAEPPRRWGPRLPGALRDLRREEPVWIFPEPAPTPGPSAQAVLTTPDGSFAGAYYGTLPWDLPDRLPKAQITASGAWPDIALPADLSFGSLADTLRELRLPRGAARIDVAGHWATASYDPAARRLSLTAPLLGLDRGFRAETGRDVERILRRLWRNNRSTLETAYLQWSAAHNPSDPVAGNPWSTMSLMTQGSVESFFYTSSLAGASGGRPVVLMRSLNETGAIGERPPRRFDRSTAVGLPGSGPAKAGAPTAFSGVASAAAPLGAGGRAHVVFSAPMTWAASGGAHRLNGAVNVGLLGEVLPDWTLGVIAQGGLGAQTDAGAAWLAGGSIASRYTLEREGLSLSVLNSVSSLSTLPFDYGGRQVSYELSNIALRNGVAAERPMSAPDGIRPTHLVGLELSETRFTGDDLYVEQSWEAAVTWRRVEPGLGEVAAARLSALATDAGDTGARLSLDLAF